MPNRVAIFNSTKIFESLACSHRSISWDIVGNLFAFGAETMLENTTYKIPSISMLVVSAKADVSGSLVLVDFSYEDGR